MISNEKGLLEQRLLGTDQLSPIPSKEAANEDVESVSKNQEAVNESCKNTYLEESPPPPSLQCSSRTDFPSNSDYLELSTSHEAKETEVEHENYHVAFVDPWIDQSDKIEDINVNQAEEIKKRNMFIFKVLKTICLVYLWTCLGLHSEILGPSLIPLINQTKSNREGIGSALSIRAVGMLVGSVCWGLLGDKIPRYRDFLLSVAIGLSGLTNILVPHCLDLSTFTFTTFVAGFGHGAMTSNGNPTLANLWGSQAAGPFNLMHSGYGLGGAMAPLFLSPFTYPVNPTNFTDTNNATTSHAPLNGSCHAGAADDDYVDILPAYLIVAALCFSSSFIFFIFGLGELGIINLFRPCLGERIIHDTDEKKIGKQPLKEKMSLVLPLDGNRNLLIRTARFSQQWLVRTFKENRTTFYILPSVFITYLTLVGNERVFGKFMFDYAKCGPLSFTTQEGYALNSAYWVSFCMARIIVFFISLCIHCRFIMISLLIGTFVTSLGMCLIPNSPDSKSRILFFILSTAFGLFKSPLFPTGLGVINTAVPITGIMTTFVNLGSSSGAASLQYVAGYLIEYYTQIIFPYLVFGTAVILLICGLSIVWITRWILARKTHTVSIKEDTKDVPHEMTIRLDNLGANDYHATNSNKIITHL